MKLVRERGETGIWHDIKYRLSLFEKCVCVCVVCGALRVEESSKYMKL